MSSQEQGASPNGDRAAAATQSSPQAVLSKADIPSADYVIRKNGYYYRPNAQGYTSSLADAGRFTLGEAIKHSHPNGRGGPRDGITYDRAPVGPPNVPSEPPAFTSAYAIVDVMKGRKAIARHIAKHGPVRVTIVADLTEPYGSDDGTSIEFNANVISIAPAQGTSGSAQDAQRLDPKGAGPVAESDAP